MERTIDEKLSALAQLQIIHSKLDKIRQIRGGLPEEVQDLQDEIEGLQTRVARYQEEIDNASREIANRNITIREARDKIKKYEHQQQNVRNSKEFESITHEIEMQMLEIQTCERRINQFNEIIKENTHRKNEILRMIAERQADLDSKQAELETLMAETEKEEKEFEIESEKAAQALEPRLLNAYNNIRRNMRNGLAVVTIDRHACGGCFAIIPPQREAEIRQKKKIIVCENCGRILVDNSYFPPKEQPETISAQ
ncbi:MAG: C4-type zinc ribbon domain-containing protein [Bacteroidia bacterium]|nr:C4-type zinc ribbon domain-containing protein [Bacteroidia bacterium]